MEVLYIVAGPEYWESIPKHRQLPCKRVRISKMRIPWPDNAQTYVPKAEAMKNALITHQQLVCEMQYAEDNWYYQLLLGFQ